MLGCTLGENAETAYGNPDFVPNYSGGLLYIIILT